MPSPAATEQVTHRVYRTDASDSAFRALVVELDKDLAIRDGKDHAFAKDGSP
ncbi:MAG: hypothetical protein IPI55_08295 [Flavobacteriales bacterium]|nr:hypothetical protein [Flavobacteriales bacterium]